MYCPVLSCPVPHCVPGKLQTDNHHPSTTGSQPVSIHGWPSSATGTRESFSIIGRSQTRSVSGEQGRFGSTAHQVKFRIMLWMQYATCTVHYPVPYCSDDYGAVLPQTLDAVASSCWPKAPPSLLYATLRYSGQRTVKNTVASSPEGIRFSTPVTPLRYCAFGLSYAHSEGSKSKSLAMAGGQGSISRIYRVRIITDGTKFLRGGWNYYPMKERERRRESSEGRVCVWNEMWKCRAWKFQPRVVELQRRRPRS